MRFCCMTFITIAVDENATRSPKNTALFKFSPKTRPSSVIRAVVMTTCSIPPTRAYFLIAENFSAENSRPIINSRNITPSSERLEIILVSLITCPSTIPVIKRPIIVGNLSLLKISSTNTAVIRIIDMFLSNKISIFSSCLIRYIKSIYCQLYIFYINIILIKCQVIVKVMLWC